MSRNTRRTDSATDSTAVGVAVGVSPVEVEDIVSKAVSAATAVVRAEFEKLFNELQSQVQSIDDRLTAVEGSVVSSSSAAALEDETRELAASLKSMHVEVRKHAVAANDAAQYLRRNNIRIRGLAVPESGDCKKLVTEFIRKSLHVHIEEGDIEAAHTLATRTTAVKSSSQSTSQPPTVVVRFYRRDMRDSIICGRRQLKDTKVSIVEDLTSLNMELLNRLKLDDRVQKTWTWNGHVRALLKDGRKVQVRPFQTLQDCLAK